MNHASTPLLLALNSRGWRPHAASNTKYEALVNFAFVSLSSILIKLLGSHCDCPRYHDVREFTRPTPEMVSHFGLRERVPALWIRPSKEIVLLRLDARI